MHASSHSDTPDDPSPPPATEVGGDGAPLSHTAELVGRAKAGDRDALGELYTRHYERVRRCAALSMGRTLRRCEQDIEDVVHDAFVDAFDRILAGEFDEARTAGAFRKWLATIVVNKIRSRGRARRRGKGAERRLDAGSDTGSGPALPAPPVTDPGPYTIAELHDLQERVEQAIVSLGERDRTIILLRHVCGMSGEEVCAEMGLSRPAQVRWMLFRAMERLREKLEQDAGSPQTYFASLRAARPA